jgi:hypothetical protein
MSFLLPVLCARITRALCFLRLSPCLCDLAGYTTDDSFEQALCASFCANTDTIQFPSITQATNASNIRLLFTAIKEAILQNALKDSRVLRHLPLLYPTGHAPLQHYILDLHPKRNEGARQRAPFIFAGRIDDGEWWCVILWAPGSTLRLLSCITHHPLVFTYFLFCLGLVLSTTRSTIATVLLTIWQVTSHVLSTTGDSVLLVAHTY